MATICARGVTNVSRAGVTNVSDTWAERKLFIHGADGEDETFHMTEWKKSVADGEGT